MAAPGNGGGAGTGEARRLTVGEARFYAAVYATARSGSLAELCRRGCSQEEAEELFATAFERVMEAVDPIERGFAEAQMVAFIKRAVWRRYLDELDRRKMRPEVDLSEAHSRPNTTAESPEEAAEEREVVAMGRDALASLSERDRAVFNQRYQLNLSPSEIVERTPGLTRRTYRKVIQRANARAFAAFEQIEGGERCEEMAGLLRRYVTEESPARERLAVEAHLAHCRACQRAGVRMRDFLVDVASGLAVGSSALSAHSLARLASRLPEIPLGVPHGLLEALRAARGRARDLLLRAAGAAPGGGEATMGPVLTSTSVKVASVCAGIAAGACVAAGVVPGVAGVVSLGHRTGEPARGRVGRSALHPDAPRTPAHAGLQTVPESPSSTPAAKEKGGRSSRARRREEERGAAGRSQTAGSTRPAAGSAASARESPTVTGDEFGAESGQPVHAPAPSASSGSGKHSGSGEGGASSGGATHAKAGSEFGF